MRNSLEILTSLTPTTKIKTKAMRFPMEYEEQLREYALKLASTNESDLSSGLGVTPQKAKTRFHEAIANSLFRKKDASAHRKVLAYIFDVPSDYFKA